MKITGERINPHECFLCTKKEAAELFAGFDINVRFCKRELSETGKYKNADYFYKRRSEYKKYRGEHLAAALYRFEYAYDKVTCLSLYPIDKEEYSETLQETFTGRILPELLRIYLSWGSFEGAEKDEPYVRVRLLEGKFVLEQ